MLERVRTGIVSGRTAEARSLAEMENPFALRELLESYALETLARRRITDTAELEQ